MGRLLTRPLTRLPRYRYMLSAIREVGTVSPAPTPRLWPIRAACHSAMQYKRVLEYPYLAMGFANVRAGTTVRRRPTRPRPRAARTRTTRRCALRWTKPWTS